MATELVIEIRHRSLGALACITAMFLSSCSSISQKDLGQEGEPFLPLLAALKSDDRVELAVLSENLLKVSAGADHRTLRFHSVKRAADGRIRIESDDRQCVDVEEAFKIVHVPPRWFGGHVDYGQFDTAWFSGAIGARPATSGKYCVSGLVISPNSQAWSRHVDRQSQVSLPVAGFKNETAWQIKRAFELLGSTSKLSTKPGTREISSQPIRAVQEFFGPDPHRVRLFYDTRRDCLSTTSVMSSFDLRQAKPPWSRSVLVNPEAGLYVFPDYRKPQCVAEISVYRLSLVPEGT